MTAVSIWQTKSIEPGQTAHWRVGPMDLWVKWVGDEWHVATCREEERLPANARRSEPGPDVEWRRWAAAVTNPVLKISPVLPDRSVIARPDTPLRILPGQEARFFVSIPVCVKVALIDGDGKSLAMGEACTVELSRSWFGTPIEGEACFALRTRARRSPQALTPAPHRAVCPLTLRNASDDALEFQRLCLRARHLNIYQGKSHLWTNDGQVTFQGEEAPSYVAYGEGPPAYDDAGERLGEARDRPDSGFVSRTFENLKAFAHF